MHRNPLTQAEVERALAILADERSAVGKLTALTAWGWLWRNTGNRDYLARARRILDEVVAHAPEDSRERMVEVVHEMRMVAHAS